MSVIAFKTFEDRIEVAADGICLMDDMIVTNDMQKIFKLSDSLIVGATGMADTIPIFVEFVTANKVTFEKIKTSLDYLRFGKRLKDYLVDNYGFAVETLSKELGGFFIANRDFHGMLYFDGNLSPYIVGNESNGEAFGSTRTYTTTLIDAGYSVVDAIKKSAEKYNSINGNVTFLAILK